MTTIVTDPSPAPRSSTSARAPVARRRAGRRTSASAEQPRHARRIAPLIAIWCVVVLGSLALSIYLLEPLFQARRQSELLESYRSTVTKASNEARGLPGVSKPTKAPELGAPVAVVEIGDVRLQQVVVEGASSSQTQDGPGHVSGTAAPGQPGNAAIVGRRAGFGAPFRELPDLQLGATILITTTQGQVVYRIDSIEKVDITTDAKPATASTAATGGNATDAAQGDGDRTVVGVDELYGPTDDDRLTLVTSGSGAPWNASRAVVVVAKMDGKPFEPTPQGGRTDSTTGLSGESAAWAPLLLVMMGFAAAAVAAVYLYRRWSFRSAYLLTTPPLIVFTILLAETLTRLLPSWM
jgi:sortase A